MTEEQLIQASKVLGLTLEELTQKINRGEIIVDELLTKFDK